MVEDIGAFLGSMGLSQYTDAFVDNGYDDPDSIVDLEESELIEDLGMKKGHAKKFLKKVRQEKEKVEKAAAKAAKKAAKGGDAGADAAGALSDGEDDGPSGKQRRKTGAAEKVAAALSSVRGEDEDEDDDGDSKHEDMAGKKVALEGFLHKKGDKDMVKLWRKRYFRLYPKAVKGGCISYFKDNKTTVETGRIPLRGALSVEESDAGKFAFSITMKTSARVWFLRADSEEMRDKWLKAIGEKVTKVDDDTDDESVLEVSVQYSQPKEVRESTIHDPVESFDVPQHAPTVGDVHLYAVGNKGLFVHEVREVKADGAQVAIVDDLPETIDPDSLNVKLVESEGYVAESRFYKPSHSTQELLERLAGQEITVTSARGGGGHLAEGLASEKFSGRLVYRSGDDTYALLDTSDVHMLRVADLVTFTPKSGTLPSGLFRGPAFVWTLGGLAGDTATAELFYSAPRSIKWQMFYTGVLSPREDSIDLNAYVRIDNLSQRTFKDAKVMLVSDAAHAAAVKALQKKAAKEADADEPADAVSEAAGAAATGFFSRLTGGVALPAMPTALKRGPAEEVDVERQYPLPNPVTLVPAGVSNRPTHISLARGRVPCRSYYLARFDTPKYQPLPNMDAKAGTKATASVQRVIEFTNSAGDAHSLGTALPAGVFSLKRREKTGFGTRFLSETVVPHIDEGDVVTLPFDTVDGVSVSRTVTGFNFDPVKHIAVETFEVKVVNGSTFPVSVRIEESAFRYKVWEVTTSKPEFTPHPTHPRKFIFDLDLEPLGGKAELAYTVFYQKFPLPSDGESDEEGEAEEEA